MVRSINPKKNGSVGTKRPTLSVNSSIFTDKGVRKARLKKMS